MNTIAVDTVVEKKHFSNKTNLVLTISVIFLTGILLYFIIPMLLPQSEHNAKQAVDRYLSLMKKGDTDKAESLLSDSDTLIDVFDYKYLRTIDKSYEYDKGIVTRSEFTHDGVYSDDRKEFGTWENFKKDYSKSFGNSKDYYYKDNGDEIIFYDKVSDKYKIYTFLYDTQIANGLGQKLYKKIEFTVRYDKYDGFRISNINIRGLDEND